MRRGARQAKVADFRCLLIDKQNVGRFNVPMNETLSVRGTQPFGDLNAGLKHLLFGQPISLFDEIIETSMIDQLHHHIKLSVIGSRGEDLYDIGVVYRGSNACLLLQARVVVLLAAEIFAQQFQRNKPIQKRVTRFVNGAHAANTQRLNHNEMIKRPFHPHFLAAVRTGQACQRLRVRGIDSRTTGLACLCHRRRPSIATNADCNIQRFRSNEMAIVD